MADADPQATQRDVLADIPAELCTAGFDDVVEIGHGGFGVVFRCVQPLLDREVAIKVLTADLDPDNIDRFLREQRAMGRLSGHPHIVTIFQVGTTARGRPYIVMPCHDKGSLKALIRRHGPMDWSETPARRGHGVSLSRMPLRAYGFLSVISRTCPFSSWCWMTRLLCIKFHCCSAHCRYLSRASLTVFSFKAVRNHGLVRCVPGCWNGLESVSMLSPPPQYSALSSIL